MQNFCRRLDAPRQPGKLGCIRLSQSLKAIHNVGGEYTANAPKKTIPKSQDKEQKNQQQAVKSLWRGAKTLKEKVYICLNFNDIQHDRQKIPLGTLFRSRGPARAGKGAPHLGQHHLYNHHGSPLRGERLGRDRGFCGKQENGILAIPKLLDMLDVEGSVITTAKRNCRYAGKC